jgi:XTP/dITP diphosphohydrolase
LKGRDKIRIRPEVIVATQNRGKVREIKKVIKGLGFRILSLNDFPGVPQIEEDGENFLANALKKARFYSKYFGRLALADDSGLEVDVLRGRPGIYSARYAGEGASTQENNRKLLKEMEAIPLPKRGARFKCVLAIVSPEGKEIVVEGSCRGRIGFKEVGKKGFGYDPLFVVPSYGKTMAQLTLEEKNRISHRGKALRKLRRIIKGLTD